MEYAAAIASNTDLLSVLEPREQMVSALAKGRRLDGRSSDTFRSTVIQFGVIKSAHGSALVQQGSTRVMVGVRGELCSDAPGKSNEGFVSVNFEIAGGRIPSGYLQHDVSYVQSFLDELLSQNQLVDLSSLVVCRGKLVWVLYVDIMVLDYDGNLLDPTLLGIVGALETTHLETVAVEAKEKIDVAETEEEKLDPFRDHTAQIVGRDTPFDITTMLLSSQCHRKPVLYKPFLFSISFATASLALSSTSQIDGIMLADPNSSESEMFPGRLTVLMAGPKDSIVAVKKHGSVVVGDEKLVECLEIGSKRMKKLMELKRSAIEAWELGIIF